MTVLIIFLSYTCDGLDRHTKALAIKIKKYILNVENVAI